MPPRPPQTGNVEDIRVRHDWTGLREKPLAEQGKGEEVERRLREVPVRISHA